MFRHEICRSVFWNLAVSLFPNSLLSRFSPFRKVLVLSVSFWPFWFLFWFRIHYEQDTFVRSCLFFTPNSCAKGDKRFVYSIEIVRDEETCTSLTLTLLSTGWLGRWAEMRVFLLFSWRSFPHLCAITMFSSVLRSAVALWCSVGIFCTRADPIEY